MRKHTASVTIQPSYRIAQYRASQTALQQMPSGISNKGGSGIGSSGGTTLRNWRSRCFCFFGFFFCFLGSHSWHVEVPRLGI